MITELAFDINRVTFCLPTEDLMKLDIVPEQKLEPVSHRADQQPALTYLAGLGRSSQRTQWGALVLVAAVLTAGQCTPVTLPWHSLRRQHVNAVRAWLVEHRSAATGRRVMAALKGALREAWRLDQMSTDDYQRAIDVKSIRGEDPDAAAGRALGEGEKRAILSACTEDSGPAGVRNAAIFGLAVFGGLRRAEIARLGLRDYDPEQQRVIVHGKGNKRRTVYVAPGVDDALADWLHLRGDYDGPLFLAINKGGKIQPVGMTPEAIYALLLRLGAKAGVKSFSPHDLRRTFAGDMLDAGADIATVQKLMGHAGVNTTGRYDRRGERSKKAAVGKLHMPYTRRFEDD